MDSILKIFFNRVYKKVAVISSAVFIVIAVIIAAGVIFYAQKNYLNDLKRKVTEFAVIGAQQSREMFIDALQQEHITLEELFDEHYQKIGLEEFKASYVSQKDRDKISDDYIRHLMDRVVEKDVDEYYRYHTAYDRNPFLNKEALRIEEPFLKSENIDYAVLIDRNGYIPFHHAVNSRNLTGNLETDTFGNRAKRIWRNTLGKTQIPRDISYYYYRRDTNTPYLNVNAPIVLEGRHWGAFLVGYNATEIDVAMSSLRRNALFLILAIIIVTVTIYSILIIISLKPLSVLLQGVQQLDEGNLDVSIPIQSQDEIGYLSGAFNHMVTSIKAAEEQLRSYNLTLTEKVEARTRDLYAKNTKLKEALDQLKEMQHQLIMQEKMASLGNLVAGVAHEVNSPIGAVYSAADVSRRCVEKISMILSTSRTMEELNSSEQLQKSLKILADNNKVTTAASERIANIVRSLKTFARLDEADYQEADILEGLDSTLILLEHEIKDRIVVIKNFGDIPKISCYPNQLNQVFMNLLMNAVQAIDGEGRITIKTDLEEGKVTVEISDTGRGIPPQNMAKIFDPGFTTKGVGVGTGLGLSISHNIIKKHNGDIKVESEKGKGSSFTILLPINSI
jgi:signal transduction histidine kinase